MEPTGALRGAILIAILGVAVWVRIRGLSHDLPFVYDPDEPRFVTTALGMLERRNPDPRWYGAPATTTFYSLAATYAGIYVAGRTRGSLSGPEDFRRSFQSDPSVFYLSGRALSVGWGVGSVVVLFLIARRIADNTGAIFAALLLAVSPLHVQLSQNLRMDALFVFFLLLAFLFLLRAVSYGRGSDALLTGLWIGLATITKWPAVAILPVVAVATFLRAKSSGESNSDVGLPRQVFRARQVIYGSLGIIAGSVVLAPWLLLSPSTVLRDVQYEARASHLSHTGGGFLDNLTWYATKALPYALSTTGAVVAAAGLVLCLVRRSLPRVLVGLAPLSFLFFISALHLRWDRWILPVVPFACLLVGVAIDGVREFATRRIAWGSLLATVLGLVAVSQALVVTWAHDESLLRPNTMALARNWALSHVPQGSRILVERYGASLPFDRYRLFYVDDAGDLVEARPHGAARDLSPRGSIGRCRDVAQIQKAAIDFVVLGGFMDRYMADRASYPEEASRYDGVLRSGTLIYDSKTFTSGTLGPRVRVLRLGGTGVHDRDGEKSR